MSNRERSQSRFGAAPERQKAEKRASAAGRIATGKLFGDAFGYAENVSGVLVIIAHQRLAGALAILFPVT